MLLLPLMLLAAQEPILIDCDPGKFTDDNVAIAMLIRSGKFKIAGITVVAGNVWANEGLRNARATLQMMDVEDVPVHLGAQQPLRHTAEMAAKEKPLEFAGAFDLRRPRAEKETAVDFLIETLEKQPMTVLAIGPLTNIAQALQKKPSIASKIKRLVIMGGAVRVPGNSNKTAEFNFWFDPEAAKIVLESQIADKVLVGLDVCNQAVYGKPVFDAIVSGKAPFRHIFREQFGYGYPGFLKDPQAKGFLWDELAAAYLIDPSVITKSEDLPLSVDENFGERYGAVQIRPSGPLTKVMLQVDSPKATKLYSELLTR
ncbi:purine nucleosidase [Bryobacterales bacterium F-183]|nr:purine nucleosidase [Bryobacterales bacterium F-183]